MIERRPFAGLGSADHGWLKARHHFSFASYYDPQRMGWGSLRVWNDDEIASQSGFPPHPHADMEIITYVREGAISHRDSMGNAGRTEAGDVQVMSAGSGVRHQRIQPRARDDANFPDLDRADRARRRAVVGRQAVPQGRPFGAVRHAGERLRRRQRRPADPHRRARTGRDHQGRAAPHTRTRCQAPCLPGAGDRRGRGRWHADRGARRCRDHRPRDGRDSRDRGRRGHSCRCGVADVETSLSDFGKT